MAGDERLATTGKEIVEEVEQIFFAGTSSDAALVFWRRRFARCSSLVSARGVNSDAGRGTHVTLRFPAEHGLMELAGRWKG